MLVVLDDAKAALVRVGARARTRDDVQFADMREIGANPARLIPAWRQYIDAHSASGRSVRGFGEPMWAGRSDAEVVECQRHEALLNLAFADVGGLSMLCPYETGALDEDVIAGAYRSHAAIVECGARRPSDSYSRRRRCRCAVRRPVARSARAGARSRLRGLRPRGLRHLVAARARAAGLGRVRGEDIVLAVNEIATNSIRHGGGSGTPARSGRRAAR